MNFSLNDCLEIREQFASNKRRLGFLIGAGTSMVVGLQGIEDLTKVEEMLSTPQKEQYELIKSTLRKRCTGW